jgi:hypothetical protein
MGDSKVVLSRRNALLAGTTLAAVSTLNSTAIIRSAQAQASAVLAGAQPTTEELTARTVHRRAVDAAIWGQPIVSFDAMRQAYFRDAKAKYNDVIWWPNGAGWKNQSLTVNTSVRYIYFFLNTKNDRSVVLELPGEVDGASFFGTITDAWFVPLVDIGSDGADKGKGGKYLVPPPGYKDEVPAGYIPIRPNTRTRGCSTNCGNRCSSRPPARLQLQRREWDAQGQTYETLSICRA